MNKRIQLLWIGLLLTGSSCNRFIDRQPTPDSGPPPASVQALTRQYPQAQDILFTTVVPNRLWQANFVQLRRHYQALTSPTQLLTTDQLAEGSVPDSLARPLEPTVVAGGTFSNFRLRQYDWFRTVTGNGQFIYAYADYTWQQQPYTVYWFISPSLVGKAYYNAYLLPYQKTDYQTRTLADLPETIQTSLRDQNLLFTLAVIQIDAVNRRRYTLSVQQTSVPLKDQYWQLTYDDSGQLLAATNQATATLFQQRDQLPPSIQQYLQRPELAGFDLGRKGGQFDSFARHTYGSLTTYAVNVEKDKQAWVMLFSEQGQLVSQTFQLYGSF